MSAYLDAISKQICICKGGSFLLSPICNDKLVMKAKKEQQSSVRYLPKSTKLPRYAITLATFKRMRVRVSANPLK